MAEYVYDQSFDEERERIHGMERLWDPATRALIERLGIEPGWRCAEIGAGGGSMARWMAEQVGSQGRVLATDVYTKFLDEIELDNVEVRQHDILNDEPLGPEFDLVYARLVVEHLGSGALRRMVEALKPGGILLLEDYDWHSFATYPVREDLEKVTAAVLELMAEAGFDPNFGRRLPTELEAAGLEGVDAEGHVRVVRGRTPETAFFRLSLGSLRGPLVERGLLTEEEVEQALASFDEPGTTGISPVLVAAWGRRPA